MSAQPATRQTAWAEQVRARQAAVVEDVEWMLSNREHPEQIAKRLGTNPHALERRLRRLGRDDLANAVTVPTAKGSCTDCGGPTSAARITVCLSCRRASVWTTGSGWAS